ncbi:MAG: peptidoglycan-binding domain-containing protein [Cytophagaceae bacterium]
MATTKRKPAVNKTAQGKKPDPKKIVIGTLGVAAAGAGAYFLYKAISGRKVENNYNVTTTSISIPSLPPVSKSLPVGSFPIKFGDKNQKVQTVQNALIAKGGAPADLIRKSGGADGIYGNGTKSALEAAAYPLLIDEQTFNQIVGTGAGNSLLLSSGTDYKKIAQDLYGSRNIETTVSLLKGMKDVNDYTAVSEEMKKHTKNMLFVAYTLVNYLLSVAFKNESDKQRIRNEFLRMGLKYDALSDKWSLSGLSGLGYYNHEVPVGPELITREALMIRDSFGRTRQIDKNTILGRELSRDDNGIMKILTIQDTVIYAPVALLKPY